MRPVWLPAALLLAACGAAPTEPGADKAPFDFEFADPAADTIPPRAGTPADAPPGADLVQVRGRVERDHIVLVLQFGEPVVPWSRGAANSLDGFLDLDLDESAATGTPGAGGAAGSAPGLGAEFYLDLRDPRAGRMVLIEPAARRFVLVPARFEGTSVTIEIPRAELGNDDGEFRMGVVIGVPGRPITDVAPNSGNYAVHQPAGG